MGRIAAVVLAGLALSLGSAACGGGGPANQDLRDAVAKELLCHPPGTELDLHNSGLSCQAAGATLLVLAGGVKGPQVVEGVDGPWTCRDRSGPGRSRVVKCSHGKRFFTATSTRGD